MKKLILLFLTLLSTYSFCQTQIGASIPGESAGDEFGSSVAISGDGAVVAIGGPKHDLEKGYVGIYRNNSGVWEQIGQDIPGEFISDRAGMAVSLSFDGSIVAIGAPFNNGNGTSSGQVRVFMNNNGVWQQLGQDLDGEDALSFSGWSVSLSSDGSVLAIGAPFNEGTGLAAGHARIYQYNSGNSTWEQVGQDIDAEAASDEFGTGIALSDDGSIIAVGGIKNDTSNDGTRNDAGHVRVYQNQSGTWTQIGQDLDGEVANDRSGQVVSLSSDGYTVAIGGPQNNNANGSNAGHVRVYKYNTSSQIWEQLGVDIDGEDSDNLFGEAVSLSSDGTILAVGASQANSNLSGHVRIFQWDTTNTTWELQGTINGANMFDRSGYSVSLSSDGSTVITGSIWNDDSGTSSGHARIFDVSGILSIESTSNYKAVLFPNPATHEITIQLSETNQLEKVFIYNQLGQLVKVLEETTTDIQELSSGIYVIQIQTKEGKSSQKLIIK